MPKKNKKISCAIIGLGFWGKVFLRKIQASPDFALQAVATSYVDEEIRKNIGSAEIFSNGEELLKNRDCDLDFIFILNSVQNHFSLAQQALQLAKNIFLTKPLTTSLKEAEVLMKMARHSSAHVFVDHTFLFNPDFKYFKAVIEKTTKLKNNEILNLTTERMQFGKFQKNSDVLGELLYHDLYMCQELMGHEFPKSVHALGAANLSAQTDQISLDLHYAKGVTAQLFATMNSPEKRRNFRIVARKKIISWQDRAPAIFSLADYKFGWGVASQLQLKVLPGPGEKRRAGVPEAPDAIALMLKHIATCVREGQKSKIIDLQRGIEIMRIIASARQSVTRQKRVHL